MYNNKGIYEGQRAEMEEEDPEGLNTFINKQRQEALDSYPDGVEVKYCSVCGEPLKYKSMAYDEGWHFDSCL